MIKSTSGILYVRANLQPFLRPIKSAGGIASFLRELVSFDELLVPHFYSARPIWRSRKKIDWPPISNSGALGKRIAKLPNAILSHHPTHAFSGFGERVTEVLSKHNSDHPCFFPIEELADKHDFSMLLLGCTKESPGFSTVHVAQQRLGLSQRHLLRFLLRWDELQNGKLVSRMASEAPGCSLSFDKFYPFYEDDSNLVQGNWHGADWLFVPSAYRALQVELSLLKKRGRFVDCERLSCLSCRLRWY